MTERHIPSHLITGAGGAWDHYLGLSGHQQVANSSSCEPCLLMSLLAMEVHGVPLQLVAWIS